MSRWHWSDLILDWGSDYVFYCKRCQQHSLLGFVCLSSAAISSSMFVLIVQILGTMLFVIKFSWGYKDLHLFNFVSVVLVLLVRQRKVEEWLSLGKVPVISHQNPHLFLWLKKTRFKVLLSIRRLSNLSLFPLAPMFWGILPSFPSKQISLWQVH